MPAFLRLRFRRTFRHRLGATVACFAYLIATLGIPLPIAVPKDLSQPFPCQDHACGCQTAEQCWSHCCCFTPEQRLEWARAHNVEPPSYAEKPVPEENSSEQGWNTVKLRDRDETEIAPATKGCCSSRRADTCCQKGSDQGRVRWTTTIAAWRCQGLPTIWVSGGAILPVPPHVSWSPELLPVSRIPSTSEIAWDVSRNPAAPPPRLSIV